MDERDLLDAKLGQASLTHGHCLSAFSESGPWFCAEPAQFDLPTRSRPLAGVDSTGKLAVSAGACGQVHHWWHADCTGFAGVHV